MKLTVDNANYCFNVVDIKAIVPLEGRDRIVHTPIFGNMVIVSKDVKVGDTGIYIPVETQLSEDFCRFNNLYDDSSMNINIKVKGYISPKKRRIRAIKLGGFESNGIFLPLTALNYLNLNLDNFKVGMEFDTVENVKVCQKYIPFSETFRERNEAKKKGPKVKKFSRLVEGQFKFHIDTSHLGKNIHKFNLQDVVFITEKQHGSSCVCSNVLVKRHLNWFERLLKKFGVKIVENHYDDKGLYSSRKVVKNAKEYIGEGFYGKDNDIWAEADKVIRPFLKAGETVYGEIVGFTPNGKAIQKGYDYGCVQPDGEYIHGKHFKIFVYRVTMTNIDGHVIEYTHNQVKNWCVNSGIEMVPECYVGKIKDFLDENKVEYNNENFRDAFMETMKKIYWKSFCPQCKNNVPSEGVVVRRDTIDIDPYKFKNFEFLKFETSQLDSGEVSIEDQESVSEIEE